MHCHLQPELRRGWSDLFALQDWRRGGFVSHRFVPARNFSWTVPDGSILGKALDRAFKRETKKLGREVKPRRGDDISNFPIERVRLRWLYSLVLISTVGTAGYGLALLFEAVGTQDRATRPPFMNLHQALAHYSHPYSSVRNRRDYIKYFHSPSTPAPSRCG
jgi:hypothetical protein